MHTRIGRFENVKVARHRNGISGAPFYVITFDFLPIDVGCNRKMIATVFDDAGVVAVLDIEAAARGVIEFTENSWRGDQFEPALRGAIAEFEEVR